MAAGLALDKEKLPEFTRRLAKTVDEMQGTANTEHNLEIDGWIALQEINLQLAEALESLAPFGPGNEKLVLATHALKTQSVATLGRNGEHLKLKVMDETGNSQTVFWWNGAEEKDSLPQGSFDLAFSLRASDWRGKAQVQMELVDFRNLEPEKIEVARTELEIIDYRNVDQPLKILSSLLKESPTEVWAEGEEEKQVQWKRSLRIGACRCARHLDYSAFTKRIAARPGNSSTPENISFRSNSSRQNARSFPGTPRRAIEICNKSSYRENLLS